MTKEEWVEKLKNEGFKNVGICPVGPNTDFGEHTHHEHTVHVIVKGELIVSENGAVTVLKEGDRFEFPAGTTHSAKSGSGDFIMVVGVKAGRS